jgi:hypothetical protein
MRSSVRGDARLFCGAAALHPEMAKTMGPDWSKVLGFPWAVRMNAPGGVLGDRFSKHSGPKDLKILVDKPPQVVSTPFLPT